MAQPIVQNDLDNKPQTGQQNQNGQSQPGQAPTIQQYNPNKQVGSGYTNINRIVNANQNNRLGSTIGGNIQQAGQQTRQDITNAGQNFQQQSNANRSDTANNAQLVQNVLADPTKYAGQNQGNQFGTLMSGNYQGPSGIQNAAQLQAKAQDVNQLGQSIGSEAGRQGLLQRFVGNPQYNAGQQTLDSLLLGQTGAKDLTAARRSTAGVQNLAQNQIGGAAATAQEYANRARQFGQDIQGKFGDVVNKENTSLTQQAQTAQQQRDAQVAALQAQLGQGNISQDVANQLGIIKGQLSYNLTPDKFVNENALQANAQNIAGTQDYARMQALQQLGGGYAPSAAQQTLGQFSNPSKAGTFQASKAYDVNAPGFQQALQGAQASNDQFVSNVWQPAMNAYKQALQGATMASAFTHRDPNSDPAVIAARNKVDVAQKQADAQRGSAFNIVPDTTGQS